MDSASIEKLLSLAKSLADGQGLSKDEEGPVNEEGLPYMEIREEDPVEIDHKDAAGTTTQQSTRQSLPPTASRALDPSIEAILARLEQEEEEEQGSDHEHGGLEENLGWQTEDRGSSGSIISYSDRDEDEDIVSEDDERELVKASLQSLEDAQHNFAPSAMKATGSKAKKVTFASDVDLTEKESRTLGPWANPANASSIPAPTASAKRIMTPNVLEKSRVVASSRDVPEADLRPDVLDLTEPVSRMEILTDDLDAKEIAQRYHRQKPSIEAAMQTQLEIGRETTDDEDVKVSFEPSFAESSSEMHKPKISRFRARRLQNRPKIDEAKASKPSTAIETPASLPRTTKLGPVPVLSKEAREWLERVNAKDRSDVTSFVPYNEDLSPEQEALLQERIKIFER